MRKKPRSPRFRNLHVVGAPFDRNDNPDRLAEEFEVLPQLPDAPIKAREIWLSGDASPKARREIEARGIHVVERLFETMVPRLSGEPAAP